jgi:MFS transporter, ACS family, hexuronate transporter
VLQTSSMVNRSRWVPIGFLFAGGMINYMDRSALSVAAPMVMKDLGLDAAQLGIIFSSFFAGYTLFTFIGGYAADILGPKRVFTLAMTVWSTFCGLTAAAAGFTSLLILRTIFGFGEGPFGAAANKMVGNWFPRRQVATAIGLANAGTPIGGALAGPVAGWLAVRYGWRISFVALAGIGFLWTFFWSLIVHDRPQTQKEMCAAEPMDSDSSDSSIALRAGKFPLSFYLRQPAVIATGISFFGYAYILYFFLSWFPVYLTMAQHLTIRDMGFVNSIPWILGAIGLTLSGLVCDLLSRISGDLLRVRKLVLVVCLILAAFCVGLAGLFSSLVWAVAFMSAAIFFVYLTGTTYWAIIQETVPGEHMGAASGFVHLIANCAGIIGPAVTGFIVQATGIFTSAFLLAGGVAVLGALLVAIFVKPIEERPGSYARLM